VPAPLRARFALPLVAVVLVFAAKALTLTRLVGVRPRLRRAVAALGVAAGAAGAVAACAIRATRFEVLSAPVAVASALLAAQSLGLATSPPPPTPGPAPAPARPAPPRSVALRGPLLAALYLAVSLPAALLLRDLPSATVYALRALMPHASVAVAAWSPLGDLDGDGYSGLFGGPDCAPFDATVAPDRAEQPGNGVDDNCLGGDADPARVAAFDGVLRGPERAPSDRGAAPSAAPGPDAPRVLFVTIDALRYDAHLPRTEALLGDRCTRFPAAYVAYPMTTFSFASTFASRFPSQLAFTNVRAEGPPLFSPAPGPEPTLAEVLRDAGWRTGAAVFHYYFRPSFGMSRGFEEVWTSSPDPAVIEAETSRQTAEMAAGWLAERDGPYFFWTHFYDPHDPYLRHPESPPGDDPRALYEGEIAHVDVWLAWLLASLRERLAQTAVVITGDHGEAFGEHGQVFHHSSVYDEQVRVPLWVCPPRGSARPALAPAVSLLDVAPTVLDWAGIEAPATFLGRSLLAPPAPRPVFSEILYRNQSQALVDWPYKLVRFRDLGVLRLFDLSADPTEQRDLATADPARREAMAELLDVWLAFTGATGDIRLVDATPQAAAPNPRQAPESE
jgi:arylsulfatase A-like enzyme